jgi:hypothetical protein
MGAATNFDNCIFTFTELKVLPNFSVTSFYTHRLLAYNFGALSRYLLLLISNLIPSWSQNILYMISILIYFGGYSVCSQKEYVFYCLGEVNYKYQLGQVA